MAHLSTAFGDFQGLINTLVGGEAAPASRETFQAKHPTSPSHDNTHAKRHPRTNRYTDRGPYTPWKETLMRAAARARGRDAE